MLGALLSLTLGASCVTPCGMRSSDFGCIDLARAERRTLAAFERYVQDFDRDAACKALSGWKLRVRKQSKSDRQNCSTPGAWVYTFESVLGTVVPFCVLGYTEDATKTVHIEDVSLSRGSYAHELIHVFDLARTGAAGHCAWAERGIKRALLELTGTPDRNQPELNCAEKQL